ncbi:MAG TPA: nucleotidyltransferase family protein [Candidatus Polarisedimenticolaceae bacterium]|nr:nucleotidyltransferase family protein [Candidatus Polarisedimenticolaceae bacterium]
MRTVIHPADEIVRRVLRDPGQMDSLSAPQWDQLLRRARRAGVLYRIAVLADGALHGDGVPDRVRHQLQSARMVAARHDRSVRWEVARIRRALRPTGERFVLLKGAAYVIAGLPAASGRISTDVDVLVAEDKLAVVEAALLGAGWTAMKLHPYDQRYYRRWMHELPPLRHATRGTVVDVHHTILPRTSRFRPKGSKLLENAVRIDDDVSVLAAEDMVLHAATHLFADGDLAGGLRELTDIDAMLRHFPTTVDRFWHRLVPRSLELDLQRPLFYALRFCRRSLDTPVPDEVVAASADGRPSWPALTVMDRLVDRALLPEADGNSFRTEASLWMLYVRSHWLRMPPWLLSRHLTRKAIRRLFGRSG